jgi:hypothetical protein
MRTQTLAIAPATAADDRKVPGLLAIALKRYEPGTTPPDDR